MCATFGARWSSLTITRMPLDRRNSVVPAWAWPTVAVGGVGGGPCRGEADVAAPGASPAAWAQAVPAKGPMREARKSEERMRRGKVAAPALDTSAQWFMRPRLLEFCRLILPGYRPLSQCLVSGRSARPSRLLCQPSRRLPRLPRHLPPRRSRFPPLPPSPHQLRLRFPPRSQLRCWLLRQPRSQLRCRLLRQPRSRHPPRSHRPFR